MKQWLENKWLSEHRTSSSEIKRLLKVVERDIRDSKTAGMSADWKLAIAYNAILQCSVAALAASGYRPVKGAGHHHYAIESMRMTLGISEDDVRTIEAFRKKRNIADYEMAGAVSSGEADEIGELAEQIFNRLKGWLAEKHPDFFRSD